MWSQKEAGKQSIPISQAFTESSYVGKTMTPKGLRAVTIKDHFKKMKYKLYYIVVLQLMPLPLRHLLPQ